MVAKIIKPNKEKIPMFFINSKCENNLLLK